jgi:predicted transcriptional regulator
MKENILLLLCVLCANLISAQELTIEVERDTFNLEEQFIVKYSIDESCNASNMQFESFIIVSGPSISRSISIVNGKRSAETTATYLLTAIEEGTFELPSEMCGTKMSKPLKIVVKKGYETLEDAEKRIREKRKIKKI